MSAGALHPAWRNELERELYAETHGLAEAELLELEHDELEGLR